ncbi:serine/threonine kinase 33 [Elysia marginata]|uniref:Serine/threonine kinase 33 n=1 Tax=Elysia marginata TaxID=1093978 RepID=A0AAV4G7X5_9GAST|nr:serine/threonine kinase 33 [Elysia marginata]
MSTDQLSSGGTRSLATSANNGHDANKNRNAGSAKATANSTKSAASATHTSSGSSPSPHGSGSSSSAQNRQENNNTNTSQTRAGGGGTGSGAGGSGPRKNSAERSIAHTRMDDESVQLEYEYGQILGEGSFGKVYRAQHRDTGEVVAIKEIVKEKAGSSGLKQLDKEVSIFKKVDHKNIIKLKEVLESPKKMYLIMEVCEGGDLAKLLQKRQQLNEADTKQVMLSLAEAIKYLHQLGILHRDLKLENLLLAEEPGENGTINIKWKNNQTAILKSAESSTGVRTHNKPNRTPNSVIQELSTKHKNIRIQIENCKCGQKRAILKRERNSVLHNIRKLVLKQRETELGRKADEISNAHNGHSMFKAVKELNKKQQENLKVEDTNGELAINPNDTLNLIASFFKEKFQSEKATEIEAGSPRKLHQPITKEEVKKSFDNLNNNRAPGEDGIHAELLIYGTQELNEQIAKILNQTFERHENLDINAGQLIAIPKPGKPKGPPKNLGPITLLNTIRKALSKIVLERIRPHVEQYLSHSQSGFRSNQSTSDVAWTHKWLAAKVNIENIAIKIAGIDILTKYPKDNELNESIAKDGPKFSEPQWRNVSDQAKRLLEEMLTINPAYRLSSGELLNHEWFTGKKREYGNVLELMKEYRLEKQAASGGEQSGENVTQNEAGGDDKADSSAINGETPASLSKDSDKKGPRKGSGGKKNSAGDTSLKLPATSTYLKPQTKKSGVTSLTPSPRPPSKTPTPKDVSSSSRMTSTSTKTTATKTTSKPQAFSSPNGPAAARVGQSSSLPKTTAVAQKAKKK